MAVVEIRGDREILERLRAAPQVLHRALLLAGADLEREVKINLSGKILHVRTDRLRSSIAHGVDPIGDWQQIPSSMTVWVGTKVIYAPVHEFGSDIFPKTRKFLVFEVEGRKVFSKHVRIPARPYMEPALRDRAPAIVQLIGRSIVAGLGGSA
jgi:phage gpG-like protein